MSRLCKLPLLLLLVSLSLPAQVAEFAWSGAVTESSIRVKAKTLADSPQVRLVVSRHSDLSDPVYSDFSNAALTTNNRVADLLIDGLEPNTAYHYGVEVDGTLDALRGQFTTFPPAATPSSFRFVFSSCSGFSSGSGPGATPSNHPVFEKILEESPLFFMNVGDIHYSDINVNDRNLFRRAFDDLHVAEKSPRQRTLYQNVPLVYVWDDHDFGPNDSGAGNPAKEAAQLTYREYVPHYPLANPTGPNPIQQSFAIGRVKFIMTDLRSERELGGADPVMMGAEQLEWFKGQLIDGRDNYVLTFWVNSVPWIADELSWADHWGAAAEQRREIAQYMVDQQVNNVVVLSGDSHMVAADDGSNNNYAAGGGPNFPVLQAAALQRGGSVKGGPYSEGTFPNPNGSFGQYGVVEVEDSGSASIRVNFYGKRSDNKGNLSTLLTYSVAFPVGVVE